jgi:hypothetical protein
VLSGSETIGVRKRRAEKQEPRNQGTTENREGNLGLDTKVDFESSSEKHSRKHKDEATVRILVSPDNPRLSNIST